jgi:hypothetical protein
LLISWIHPVCSWNAYDEITQNTIEIHVYWDHWVWFKRNKAMRSVYCSQCRKIEVLRFLLLNATEKLQIRWTICKFFLYLTSLCGFYVRHAFVEFLRIFFSLSFSSKGILYWELWENYVNWFMRILSIRWNLFLWAIMSKKKIPLIYCTQKRIKIKIKVKIA